MEGSGTGISSRLDCYEDMFKEITRKLYGEDPDHRTSNVQNEFETSVTYKNDDDTGNGTDGSDDGNWTYEEEHLKGTDGSRIAAYHAGKATWRCDECGDIMGGGPREAAEHFIELHSSRILTDNRNRHHSPRKDYLQMELKIEDVILYLERLRERAERVAPPSRRTQETQTVPAALLPVTSGFLLQELPSTAAPHLQQNAATIAPTPTASTITKRYCCQFCPYGTDRRDLFTRHENIHREDKPFQCYVCLKSFNRADHVKKHFLRMHREHQYELSRIRKPPGSNPPKPLQQDSSNPTAAAAAAAAAVVAAATAGTSQQPQQQHANYQSTFASNQLQQNPGASSNGTNTIGIYHQATAMAAQGIMQPDNNTGRRVQNGGCNSKSHLKGGSKGTQERRYICNYCQWTGLDNWCLKRHLNTHTKPYACTLCEYKAARAERLSTHVLKVHNKRQCSRCRYLGEDLAQLQLHQLHHHRINNGNAPSTSTAQTAPLLSNRHQQSLHPVGGRPPPGPPVFPAPIPAITPANAVIPSTSEMVKSPATAATMEYPTEEERRSHPRTGGIKGDDGGDDGDGDADDDGDDDDGVVRGNGNRDAFSRYVRGVTSDSDDDRVPSNGNINIDTIANSNFACSYEVYPNGLVDLSNKSTVKWISPGTRNFYETEAVEMKDVEERADVSQVEKIQVQQQENKENHNALVVLQNKPIRQRRCRKQSRPMQIIWNIEDTCDSCGKVKAIPALGRLETTLDIMSYQPSSQSDESVRFERSRRLAQLKLRCCLCPRYSPARERPYHTKPSLTLHKLWWHKRKMCAAVKTLRARSIVLTATDLTNQNYRHHR